MKTKKERTLGLLRELLTAGGALAFGTYEGLPSIIGLIVAASAVVWAIVHHEGEQVIATSLRKTLSLLPGMLLAIGFVSVDTSHLLAAFIAPLFAIVWSFLDKNGEIPKSSGKFGALVVTMLALSCLSLVSCSGQYGTVTTGYYKQTEPGDPLGKFGAFASLSKKAKEKLAPSVEPAK